MLLINWPDLTGFITTIEVLHLEPRTCSSPHGVHHWQQKGWLLLLLFFNKRKDLFKNQVTTGDNQDHRTKESQPKRTIHVPLMQTKWIPACPHLIKQWATLFKSPATKLVPKRSKHLLQDKISLINSWISPVLISIDCFDHFYCICN